MMRTTINLPDDVYSAARALAQLKGISLGHAVAELARKGLRPSVAIDASKPFPCFSVPVEARPMTVEQMLEAEDEL